VRKKKRRKLNKKQLRVQRKLPRGNKKKGKRKRMRNLGNMKLKD